MLTKERESNFEIFRLVLMLMICIHHGIVHGLGLTALCGSVWTYKNAISDDGDMLFFCIINCFCIVGVNAFILISGYFGIKPKLKKILKLIISMAVFTLFFTIFPLLYEHDVRGAILSMLVLSHSPYWFMINYLLLMTFAPMINMFFEGSSKRVIQSYILTLLFVSCYLGFIRTNETNENGYSLFQFIMMYSLGRYIKVYKLDFSRLKSIITYFILSILCGGLMFFLYKYSKHIYAWRITYYNNPLLILSSLAIFFWFKNIRIRSKFVNNIATSTLAIYLLQSSHIGGKYYEFINNFYVRGGGKATFLIILFFSISISICAILADKCFTKTEKYILLAIKKLFCIQSF